MEDFQKHKISIRFLLYGYGRLDRKTYNVYAALILDRKCTQLSMKIVAKAEDWDHENERFLQHKQYCIYANNKLLEEKNNILTAYYDLKKKIAKPSLRAVVDRYRGKAEEYSELTLIRYWDIYVEEIKQLPGQYSTAAIDHYRKVKNHLILFLKKKGLVDIRLSELNRNFIVGFEHHLLTTPNLQNGHQPMNENTAGTYLKKLKAVVNNAIKKEILARNPFAGFQVKKSKKTNRVYLTRDEIRSIEEYDFSKEPRLDKARDFFLFSVYSGLRHSDAFNLKEENIKTDREGVKWICIQQIKTNDPLEVPMLTVARNIYEKYKEHRKETGFVFPRFYNHHINRDIKIIARKVGITKRLSHHCARHTFATTVMLERGVELKTTSKFMGHNSVKSTEVYGKISNVRLVETASELNSKLR